MQSGSLISSVRRNAGSIAVLLALATFALAVPMLLPTLVVEYLIGFFGYFAVFALVCVSGVAIGRAVPWRNLRSGWNRRRVLLVALLALVSGVTTTTEPVGFKVVMDEPLLAAVSASMHRDRLALYPDRGHDLEGHYAFLDGKVDKRPLLFPFLVSVLHDTTGYRISNAFLLNILLVPLFWMLVFRLGRRFGGGSDAAGGLAVALLLTMPLIPHLATSGGFDFLSGTLLLASLFWGMVWRSRPEDDRIFSAFVGSLLLLAHARYEGPYWILPFGILILRVWWVRGFVSFPRIAVAAPVLMLPALLHRQVHADYTHMWQKGIFERETTFSIGYVAENLEGAAAYFFNLHGGSTNSFLLSVLSGAGLLTVVAYLLVERRVRRERLTPDEEVGAIFLAGLAGLFALLMAFNWGYFNNYITARLSLPIVLGGAFSVVWALWRSPRVFTATSALIVVLVAMLHLEGFSESEFLERGIHYLIGSFAAVLVLGWMLLRDAIRPLWFTGAALVYVFWSTLPRLNVHAHLESYHPRTPVAQILDFLERHEDESLLFVSHLPFIGAMKFVPSVSNGVFLNNRDLLERRLNQERYYQAIYHYEVATYNPLSEEWKAIYGPELGSEIELELIERWPIGPRQEGRFYRVTGMRESSSETSENALAVEVEERGAEQDDVEEDLRDELQF